MKKCPNGTFDENAIWWSSLKEPTSYEGARKLEVASEQNGVGGVVSASNNHKSLNDSDPRHKQLRPCRRSASPSSQANPKPPARASILPSHRGQQRTEIHLSKDVLIGREGKVAISNTFEQFESPIRRAAATARRRQVAKER